MKTLVALVTLGMLSWSVNADSCSNRCGSVDNTKDCQCNSGCTRYGDCCADYNSLCVANSDSCTSRCGLIVDSSKTCQCNTQCKRYKDCCPDYDEQCKGDSDGNPPSSDDSDSCSSRCGLIVDSSKTCQCNIQCKRYKDCCSDYDEQCKGDSDGNPPSSDGATDITTIANSIWSKDVNRLATSQYSMDYQTWVYSSGTTDESTRKLFRGVVESNFRTKVTYQRFIALLNNYDSNVGRTESITTAEWKEVDDFLNAILVTSVMNATESFLRNNGKVSGGRTAFKDKLFNIWFRLYKRTSHGRISSSGFEHVFVGETSSSKVTGFHNWIQFYLEEKAGRLDYAGYVYKLEPRLIGSQFSWGNNLWKAKGTFFVGTSPEFDMAIYTICFLMSPGADCKFKIANHDLVIITYDNNNVAGQQIATAYVK